MHHFHVIVEVGLGGEDRLAHVALGHALVNALVVVEGIFVGVRFVADVTGVLLVAGLAGSQLAPRRRRGRA